MESVTCDESLGEHRARNHHHRGRQVECYLLNHIPFGRFYLFQDTDYFLSSGSSDHSHQRTPAAPAGLVGQKSIDLAAAQAGFVDTQALPYIIGEQQPVFCMRQLVPLAIIAEMLLVLRGKLFAVHPIVGADAGNALRSRLNPILLKKKRTQGIVYCPQPSGHRRNN